MIETPGKPSVRDTDAVADLYRRARGAAWIGLLVNVLLAVIKLFAGILGQSIALVADAINSIGDGLTSGVILWALGIAQRPADSDHPYGHSRAEGIAALSVALFIGMSAIALAIETLRHFGEMHALPPAWTLWIAGGNVVIKEGMYQYKKRVAIRTGSESLVAGAWDHRSDALCSGAVLIGLMIVRYGGATVIWADEIAALVVVALILWASVKLFRRNASLLMDQQVESELVRELRSAADSVEGVVRIEQIRARRSGLEVFVDIHVEVDAHLTVAEGHRIAHLVRDELTRRFQPVSQVLVHIEPAQALQAPHQSEPSSRSPVVR